MLFAAVLKLKEDWSGGGTKSTSPGPQQRRLPVGFQQASLTSVFDLKLAIKLSASVIVILVRVAMVSADTPCRCCGLGGFFYILLSLCRDLFL